jgi:hypothetical protein
MSLRCEDLSPPQSRMTISSRAARNRPDSPARSRREVHRSIEEFGIAKQSGKPDDPLRDLLLSRLVAKGVDPLLEFWMLRTALHVIHKLQNLRVSISALQAFLFSVCFILRWFANGAETRKSKSNRKF